jgi:heme A synthase
VIHPVFAVLTGSYLYFVVLTVKKRELGGRATFLGNLLFALAIMQGLAGGITILTLAPLYMQIIHLLLADVFWITLVLFSAESITEPARRS